MHFLPDVYITCETCGGKRFGEETLQVLYKGLNIFDILETTVEEAAKLFEVSIFVLCQESIENHASIISIL